VMVLVTLTATDQWQHLAWPLFLSLKLTQAVTLSLLSATTGAWLASKQNTCNSRTQTV